MFGYRHEVDIHQPMRRNMRQHGCSKLRETGELPGQRAQPRRYVRFGREFQAVARTARRDTVADVCHESVVNAQGAPLWKTRIILETKDLAF